MKLWGLIYGDISTQDRNLTAMSFHEGCDSGEASQVISSLGIMCYLVQGEAP